MRVGILGILMIGAALSTSNAVAGPGSASPPAAFHRFCSQNPFDCRSHGSSVKSMPMNASRWSELRSVNQRVNRAVREVSDRRATGSGDVWSLPVGGKGDCEDFALMKKHQLLKMGWPSSVLLITIVRNRQGQGHAVLTVSTSEGDYVLDNLNGAIVSSTATGYRFFSRQSKENPRKWVAVPRDGGTNRPIVTASAADRTM
jgi:predicted transglutaminase-like cysteine proteinase